jgi:penicillin amidase
MRTIFKWLLRGLFLVVAAAGIGAAFVFAAFYSTVPAASGRAAIPGLSTEARIVREANGIAHIEAATHADAARALGYAHAQDRFWQMHVLRRVAEGRLSELFGSATVNTDIFLRAVDLAGSAKASYDNLGPDAKAILQAYSQGVNSWLSRDVSLLSTRLPPEFLILGKEAEPWEPWQSVSILKVMALTLDSNMDSEIRRLALAARGFSPREIDDLLPYSPRDNPPPLPDLRMLYGFGPEGKPGADAGSAGGTKYAEGLAWPVGVTASNNWAVAGTRTETGKPLLANDPHLGLTTPTIFYLAHLTFDVDGRKKDVIGASLPGTPLVLAGRTAGVAWGLTTTNLDSQDLFIERVKPDDPNLYYRMDGWKPFETQDITIAVSGGEPVTFVRRSTDKGPVLPDTYRSLPAILPGGHVAALSWVSLATDDTTVEAALALNRAETVADALAATRLMVAPMQSIVLADTAGNIALVAPGRVPLRSPMNLVNGRAPVPGWLPEYGWTGFMAQEQLPRIENPAAGALATANGDWLPMDYAGHITHDFDEQFRQSRVETMVIETNAAHSMETMKAIQGDDFSPAVDEFRREAIAQLAGGSGQDAELIPALKAWDGQMAMDRPEPLVFTAWWRHMHEALFSDDLGEDYARFASGRLQPVLTALTSAGGRDWCDNRETSQSETCGILLAQSLSKALDEIRSVQGPDWKQWQWGNAHPAFGEHRPFSSVAPLAPIFTVSRPSAGDSYSLLRGKTDFSEKEPYRNVHASAYRAIYDLSDMDASLFVTSTGQSGHFLSPHYDDFADRWSAVDYVTMTTNPDDYRTRAAGTFVLEPAAD